MVDQRAWRLKWGVPGGTLPVVNDGWLPDPLARLQSLNAEREATKQDVETTTNQQAGSSWVDAPAPAPQTRVTPSGGGVFGTSYADPGGGWNPWSLYDGREGYDGTARDGWYNAATDTKKGWGPNGTPEFDRDRVWRLTLQALGANPGGQDPARVKAEFLNQVARLKRDYRDTPGLGLAAWANSPFARYDQMPGTQGGQQAQGQAPAGVIAGASNAAAQAGHNAAAQTGGTGVADQNGGGGGGNPITNPPTPGAFGGAGFANMQEPQMAIRQYMQTHGMNPDGNGFFGDWIKKLMGSIGPAIMSLTLDQNGQPALDQLSNLNNVLDPIFFGGAGTLGANLQGFANKAQSGLMGALPGVSVPNQAALLRNLTALRTAPMNPYMAEATNNRLDTAINAARDYAFKISQQGGDTPNEWSLWDYINNQLPQGYVNPLRR